MRIIIMGTCTYDTRTRWPCTRINVAQCVGRRSRAVWVRYAYLKKKTKNLHYFSTLVSYRYDNKKTPHADLYTPAESVPRDTADSAGSRLSVPAVLATIGSRR